MKSNLFFNLLFHLCNKISLLYRVRAIIHEGLNSLNEETVVTHGVIESQAIRTTLEALRYLKDNK